MKDIRVVAIPTEIASAVRTTMRAPVFGFPAHAEIATDDAPCRHCLRTFAAGVDRRILFTYDRFAAIEELPQPGPVYIHAEDCPRYCADAGFPEELRGSPRTLEGYGRGRRLVAQEYVTDGRFEPVVERIFELPEVDYIQVNSTMAGCYTFRVERGIEIQRNVSENSGEKDHVTAKAQGEAIIQKPLLTAEFDPAKTTSRLEVKEIEFKPGQATGLHLHPCPVTGYIAAGAVLFQVEGQPARTLTAGEAFFEPENARIVHFDNASSSESMRFIAFYLLGAGETELIRMLEERLAPLCGR